MQLPIASRMGHSSRLWVIPPLGESYSSSSSQSSAAAAVQDWLRLPSGAPVIGWYYSAKVSSPSCPSDAERNRAATSVSPSRCSAQVSSQVNTGHTGPRQ